MTSPAIRTSALSLALGVLGSLSAAADDTKMGLAVGNPAPGFTLADDAGRTWKSSEHFGKGWVVVYFYPGDFTPGCTAQAKAFKAGMDELSAMGVEVVGVSGDSVKTH